MDVLDTLWIRSFHQHFRRNAETVTTHGYDPEQVGCVLLYTSHETPLDEGDVLSNANTLLYLDKIREGTRFRRALYVAKHRGSACTDEILPYTIDDGGWRKKAGEVVSPVAGTGRVPDTTAALCT